MFVLAFTLAACSSSSNNDTDKKEESKKTSSEDVLNYYMDLVSTISDKNADYSAYLSASTADPKPSEAELAELAKKASTSAQAVSDALAAEKVPDLGKSTDDFKKAVSDLSAAYADEATALNATPVDTTSADEKLQKASADISKILEDNGLAGSDILTDTM